MERTQVSPRSKAHDVAPDSLDHDELLTRLQDLSDARLVRWRRLARTLWAIALAVIAIAFLAVPVTSFEAGDALAAAMLVILATVVIGSVLGLIAVARSRIEARREAKLFISRTEKADRPA